MLLSSKQDLYIGVIMAEFYSRRFNVAKQLEGFINWNKIERAQIVSISNTAFQKVNGETSSSSFLYFYAENPLDFDLFEELSEERQKELTAKAIETEGEKEKQKRISELKQELAYHSNPKNYSVDMPEMAHLKEVIRIEQEIKNSKDAVYTKVIQFAGMRLVPTNFNEMDGQALYELIVKINPLVKVQTEWVYVV